MLIRVSFHTTDGAFRQDGDPTLLLQVIAVQRPVRHLLMLAERPRLAEQLVHQRGLPVVDMGNDSDVTNLHTVLALKRGLWDGAAHT